MQHFIKYSGTISKKGKIVGKMFLNLSYKINDGLRGSYNLIGFDDCKKGQAAYDRRTSDLAISEEGFGTPFCITVSLLQ